MCRGNTRALQLGSREDFRSMLLDELAHLLAQGSRDIGTALGSLDKHTAN